MNPVRTSYEPVRRLGRDSLLPRFNLLLRAWTLLHRLLAGPPRPDLESQVRALDTYRALFEEAPFAYLSTDTRRRLQRVNRHACEMLGYRREELVGRPSLSLFAPGRPRRRARDLMERFFDGREIVAEELEMISRAGRRVPVLLSAVAERDRRGRVLCSRTVAVDITSRKQMEAELRRAGRIETLEQLAAGIGHDLNNLLGAIRGHASLALETKPSAIETDLRRIETLVDRATRLNGRLFDFGERDPSRFATLQVGPFLESRRDLLASVAGTKVRLTMRLPGALGSIRGDAVDLERLLVNLVANARDAMPEGGRVSIAAANQWPSREGDEAGIASVPHVLIVVHDSGPGIDPEIRDRAFEPFVTTKSRRPGAGVGLGLAAVREIARRHEGTVELDSTVDVGTTVRLRLPRTDLRGAERERPLHPRDISSWCHPS